MSNHGDEDEELDRKANFDQLLLNQFTIIDQFATSRRNYIKTGIDRRTRGYVSKRIESIDALWNQFQANDKILRTFKEYRSTDYAAKNSYSEFDDAYSSFSGDLSDVMHTFDDHAQAPPVVQQIPQEQQNQNQNQAQRRPEFRLPNISIPVFDGDYAS